MDEITKRQAQRFRVLKYIYDQTGGSERDYIREDEIAKALAIPKDDFDLVSTYLRRERLVTGVSGPAIAITHEGVLEVESKSLQPEQPTAHFPAVFNFTQIGQMTNSQFQQGSQSSVQTATFDTIAINELTLLLRDIKAKLPDLNLSADDRHVADDDIATIERQVASPRPNTGIIRECLVSLRAIAQGAAGGAISAGIVQGITALLGG